MIPAILLLIYVITHKMPKWFLIISAFVFFCALDDYIYIFHYDIYPTVTSVE